MKVVVFSTENCPKCKVLKQTLHNYGIEFENMDMASSDGLTELRVNGIFTLSAPVLQVDDRFYLTDDGYGLLRGGCDWVTPLLIFAGLIDPDRVKYNSIDNHDKEV